MHAVSGLVDVLAYLEPGVIACETPASFPGAWP
jgi:hypothetical protein